MMFICVKRCGFFTRSYDNDISIKQVLYKIFKCFPCDLGLLCYQKLLELQHATYKNFEVHTCYFNTFLNISITLIWVSVYSGYQSEILFMFIEAFLYNSRKEARRIKQQQK